MVEQILKYVAGEMRVIVQAPVTFAAALAVITVVIWKLVGWRHAPKDDLIALYKARLDGATPDQARAKIQALEAIVGRSIGARWDPLTEPEIQKLSEALSKIDNRSMYTEVQYKDHLGVDVAKSVASAFQRAGWAASAAIGSAMDEGITIGPFRFVKIKEAVESSTRLRVQRFMHAQDPNEDPNEPAALTKYAIYVQFGTNVPSS